MTDSQKKKQAPPFERLWFGGLIAAILAGLVMAMCLRVADIGSPHDIGFWTFLLGFIVSIISLGTSNLFYADNAEGKKYTLRTQRFVALGAALLLGLSAGLLAPS